MTTRARRATGLIKLTPDSGKPLAHQLADTLRRLIVEGIWIKDDKIPGSRTIAADARVSRNTVNSALEILTSEGMLESRGRSGLFVTWKHVPREHRGDPSYKLDTVGHRPLSCEALPLDLFPLDTWKRLQARYWSRASIASLDRGSVLGERPLREAIAVLVNVTAGVSCNADQVIVVGGLRDALALSKAALGDQRGAIWIEDPVHPRMRLAARAAELSAIPIPVDTQGIDVEAALQIEGGAKLALVRPAFQFPTGALLSSARARELTDWARRANALVVEDATECEFSFSKRAVRSLATLEPNHVVHFNSFERTAFPALRLAYVIAPERFVDAFHRAGRELDAPILAPPQIVLAEFINAGHFAKHVRRCREVAEERHAALLASLATLSSALECDRQLGGLHICARLLSNGSDALVGERAAAAGIDAAPLSATYSRKPAMQGLVLGFAAFDPQVIAQSVNALARVLPSQASVASAV